MKDGNTKFVIGENIRRFREESGKSVAELCAPLGMSRAFWYDVEKGNKEPTISTLERIAGVLKVRVHDLTEPPKRRKAS